MAGFKALILDGDAVTQTSDIEAIHAAFREEKRFWVELDERSEAADKLLIELLHIHPLAVEDIWNDIGIPKVEDFVEYVQLVMHGVREEDVAGSDIPLALTELDVIIGRNFLITHAHDETVCAVGPVFIEMQR